MPSMINIGIYGIYENEARLYEKLTLEDTIRSGAM